MRIALCLTLVASTTACSVVPPQAWSFDPTRPQPRATLSPQEAAALTDRVAQLQLQRHEIRSRIAIEPDVWKRQAHYEDLHRVGGELSPLERRLAAAAAR
jgi:hypothetical protein